MRWTTLCWESETRLARRHDDRYLIYGRPDVANIVVDPPSETEIIAEVAADQAALATLVTRPARVVCVGLNYADHVREMGRDLPDYPTLFSKFASTLTDGRAPISVPSVSTHVDWEAELAVVIGRPAYRVSPAEAGEAIAGFSAANDISMRDWQRRTTQWLAGKAFDRSTPLGCEMVTPDEVDFAADLQVECIVDGEVKQRGRTSEFIFTPADVISYVSQFTRWEPGDILLTGTPGGVGAASDEGLSAGQTVEVRIEGISSCLNSMVCDEWRV
jgi:acylpyruvate hydrolase